mmetsp:Transcript_27355/g.40388  ORF Transcript_27355/g.40388 Transcript_27355/m.40388 type:complete len:148 (-) Transcript_27355:194-637(-)
MMSIQEINDTKENQKNLADEYVNLSKQEDNLRLILDKLKREEHLIREALIEASESGPERLEKQLQAKKSAAIQRLEEALLDDSSSNSEEEDKNANDFDLSSMIDLKSRTSVAGERSSKSGAESESSKGKKLLDSGRKMIGWKKRSEG